MVKGKRTGEIREKIKFKEIKNMMNPAAIFKAKKSWETFCGNHPKFSAFLQAAKSAGLQEGTVIEVSMTTPEGKTLATNVRLTASDIEAFHNLT